MPAGFAYAKLAAMLQLDHPSVAASRALAALGGPRVAVVELDSPVARLADDVVTGFQTPGQRSLPALHLHDDTGAQLHLAVTRLPEHYPPRVEAALLARVAGDIAARVPSPVAVELGAGSAERTRLLLDAWRAGSVPMTYAPVDAARSRLDDTAHALGRDYPALRVRALAGSHQVALDALPRDPHVLVLALGDTLGSLTPSEEHALYTRLAALMPPGAHLLLGFDRRAHAGKPAARIQRAYDDAGGVTARWNLHLMTRIEQELRAEVPAGAFRHVACYRGDLHQLELCLESVRPQAIVMGGRRWSFTRGERIVTMVSRKLDPDALSARLAEHGFHTVARYGDADGLMGLLLFQREKS